MKYKKRIYYESPIKKGFLIINKKTLYYLVKINKSKKVYFKKERKLMKRFVKYLLTPRIQRLDMVFGFLIAINFIIISSDLLEHAFFIILLRLMIPVTFSYLVIRAYLFVFGDFLESFKNPKF